MPHGELEIVISGDPPLSTVAAVLETSESIYERLYIIGHNPGSSKTELVDRLKSPDAFVPGEDRLRVNLIERASLLILLHGFQPALAGLAALFGLPLAYAEIRRRLAEARKLDAETRKLDAETNKINVERYQLLQKIAAEIRALETADTRAKVEFVLDAHRKLHGVGVDIDVSLLSDYPKFHEELSAALRRIGFTDDEIGWVFNNTVQPLSRLIDLDIAKVGLR